MCKALLKLENLKQLALYVEQPGCKQPFLLATLRYVLSHIDSRRPYIHCRKCTFSLDSFCSDSALGLDSWAFAHKSLRLFALDGRLAESLNPTEQLQRMHALVQKKRESSPLFELCSFYRYGFVDFHIIELFPAFNPVKSQWTAGAAREISDRFSYTRDISSYSVYLISMSHIDILQGALSSIGTNFSRVHELRIYAEEMNIVSHIPICSFSMDPLNLSAG
jgi:hypothetical protein